MWGTEPGSSAGAASSYSLSLFPAPASTFSTSQLGYFFKRLSPHPTKAFPAHLWLNKLLLFFIYFYLKEFVSLSQKLATLPTAKFIVTLMAENSLGIPNGVKGGKKVLSTNPKPRMTLERHHMPFLSFLIICCRWFSGGSNTI